MKTTVAWKLYLYPETAAPGAPCQVIIEDIPTKEEAVERGEKFDGTNYEIQCISTTIEPPCKKYPNGNTTTSKTITTRKMLRQPTWWDSWIRERLTVMGLR